MSILGNPVLRSEDPRFLTSGGTYAADLDLPSAAHVVFVRSTAAAGVIESVEVEEAKVAPGVLAVLTSDDLDLGPYANPKSDVWRRWPLARERVRFAGEPVAVVVAETYAQALDAAESVWVDVDASDAVPSIRAALDASVRVYDELPDNVVDDKRTDDLDFSSCEVVIDAEIVNNRINGAPIEARVAAATWADDGRLTCWTSTQGAHPAQQRIASVLKLDPVDVHVITTDVGGSFGSKATPGPEECVLGAVSRIVGRPVVWAETRTENFLAMGHARSQLNRVRLGGTSQGDLTHYQLDITAEAGAYPQGTSFLPYFTQLMATGVYDIANAACGWVTVATNTAPIVAFRGAGRPEATATIERAIDLFANEVGIDPAEVRRRNLVSSEQFPFTSPMGQVYDSGDYSRALDTSLNNAGYAELRAEQQRRIDHGETTLLGIGMSSYVEITAPGAMGTDNEFGSIELLADGRILARTGSTPYGQGHETTWAMVVSDRLGISMDNITVLWGDTDEVSSSKVSGGSRSVQLAGSAMADASDRLVAHAQSAAADLLEAAPADIVFDATRGAFHVAGTPARAITWDTIAANTDALVGVSEFSQTGATFPFGSHVAVVEVDVLTGKVVLDRIVTTDDAGTLINPMIAAGQVHGGVASGVSQALFEEVTYDEYGNLTSANFADYALPAASEFPMFEVTLTETATPLNPLGAKGIGEAGSIGSTPAVQNAVIDALRHVGVAHLDLPLTPSRVWAAYTNAVADSPT